jgi:pilus assembly protein Flp/PilA
VASNSWVNGVLEVVIMKQQILKFLKEEEGLTMVEYAVAGALVAAACVVAFTGLGTAIATRISDLANTITNG